VDAIELKIDDSVTLSPLRANKVASERPAPATVGKSYIPTLDGWRAIAIGLVIGAHSQTMLTHDPDRHRLAAAPGASSTGRLD